MQPLLVALVKVLVLVLVSLTTHHFWSKNRVYWFDVLNSAVSKNEDDNIYFGKMRKLKENLDLGLRKPFKEVTWEFLMGFLYPLINGKPNF